MLRDLSPPQNLKLPEADSYGTEKTRSKKYFSEIGQKTYFLGRKKSFSEHFFSEEPLSKEQLVKKSGMNGGRSYLKKKLDQKSPR